MVMSSLLFALIPSIHVINFGKKKEKEKKKTSQGASCKRKKKSSIEAWVYGLSLLDEVYLKILGCLGKL